MKFKALRFLIKCTWRFVELLIIKNTWWWLKRENLPRLTSMQCLQHNVIEEKKKHQTIIDSMSKSDAEDTNLNWMCLVNQRFRNNLIQIESRSSYIYSMFLLRFCLFFIYIFLLRSCLNLLTHILFMNLLTLST